MKKRIAWKILNPDGFHWDWYKNRGGMWSLAPIHPALYYKVCKTVHLKPYYDKEWLSKIQKWRKESKV